jgi:hypothetical protein
MPEPIPRAGGLDPQQASDLTWSRQSAGSTIRRDSPTMCRDHSETRFDCRVMEPSGIPHESSLGFESIALT